MAIIEVTPTVTAGAYHANDCVGGKITIAGATRIPGADSVLQSVTLVDLAMQNAELVVYLFEADPAAGTYTDNAELDIHDTDAAYCIGSFYILGGHYRSAKDNSVATVPNVGILCRPLTGNTIYAVVKCTGGPTYAAVSDLKFKFGFLRD